MTIDLYYAAASSQGQAIQMVAAAIGVELQLKPINLAAGDHLKPEFVALNPQHTIPTLVDNGFALWETRAILTYLVEKYGGNDASLYPADVQQRATINQRLYFDIGTLYSTFGETILRAVRSKQPLQQTGIDKINAAFGFLNTFLADADFVAGKHLTVADIALFATVSLYEVGEFDFAGYANVARWYKQLRETVPGRDINAAGMELARQHFARFK